MQIRSLSGISSICLFVEEETGIIRICNKCFPNLGFLFEYYKSIKKKFQIGTANFQPVD